MAISGTYVDGSAVTHAAAKIEIDLTPDTPAWANLSTWATTVAVSGGDVPINEVKPFSGSTIVLPGKQNSWQVVVTSVYTEGPTDPFQNIYDAYAASPGLRANTRWSPKGGASGNFLFTTTGGRLIHCTLPQGSGESTTTTQFSYTIQAGAIVRSAI